MGLAVDRITIQPNFRHRDITLDAWGGEVPAEVQAMLFDVNISMALVYFDNTVKDVCLQLSIGGAGAIGQTTRAGTLLGNGVGRFAVGNNYIGLNIASPIGQKPWRFYFTYLTGPPMEYPLGTEKTIMVLNWRAIPYVVDPWRGGLGATNYPIWDHSLDA